MIKGYYIRNILEFNDLRYLSLRNNNIKINRIEANENIGAGSFFMTKKGVWGVVDDHIFNERKIYYIDDKLFCKSILINSDLARFEIYIDGVLVDSIEYERIYDWYHSEEDIDILLELSYELGEVIDLTKQ